MCSSRRYGHSCGERIVKAEALEGQLMDWIRAFHPDGQLHDLLLQTLKAQTAEHTEQPAERRNELLDQLQRLQALYVLGDLNKAESTMRRQALEEELQRQGSPAEPAIDRARALLEEFPRFWEIETQPAKRRKLLLTLFEQIWAQNGQIVAVQSHDDFLPYSKPSNTGRHRVVPKAGATGLEPATSAVTGQRSNQLSYAPVLDARDQRSCVAQSIAACVSHRASSTLRRGVLLALRGDSRACAASDQ